MGARPISRGEFISKNRDMNIRPYDAAGNAERLQDNECWLGGVPFAVADEGSAGSEGFGSRSCSGPGDDISLDEVFEAMRRACKGHSKRVDVREVVEDWEEIGLLIFNILFNCQKFQNNDYLEWVRYRKLTTVNNNGKVRYIDAPTLVTRVLQYVAMGRMERLYRRQDNYVGLNCKEGCGLNAASRRFSVMRRVKGLFYDKRQLCWLAVVDQRQCYAHVTEGVFRRAVKRLGVRDRWWVDFCVSLTMVEGRLPIGTPVSPLAHHIVMLAFDLWAEREFPFVVRYADNVLIACESKHEAHAAYWRVRQFWWYDIKVRANRWDSRVLPLDRLDFCGAVYRRLAPSADGHNKGVVVARRSIMRAAWRSSDANWAAYFGQLAGLDCFGLMTEIERKMKLNELTRKIRIDRAMDAPQIAAKDIEGVPFDLLDYEIRQKTKGGG